MTAATAPLPAERRAGLGTKLWNAVLAVWGAVTGALPHVLHHVGPLAGAAVLAGAGGKAIFFALGLVAAIPMLRRLHRRFRTLLAPAAAVAGFAATFTLSTLLLAPLVPVPGGGAEEGPAVRPPSVPAPVAPAPAGHADHHR